jgi:hypothetical protein
MRHIVLSGPVLDEIQEAAMVALLLRKPAQNAVATAPIAVRLLDFKGETVPRRMFNGNDDKDAVG